MNGTKATCGHFVIAVGAPGSKAREDCEYNPCDQCNQEERDALAALLRSHPKHGQKAISVNDCLRSRSIPAALKTAYLKIEERNYAGRK